MAFNFYSLLGAWEEAGIFDVILPFLLVFSLVYAVLEKIRILGTGKKARVSNAVVALVSALLVVRNGYIVGLMTRFLPNVAMFLIVILMLLLILGTFGIGPTKWQQGTLFYAAFVVSVVFVIWALASDYLGDWLELPKWLWNLDETTKATVLFVGMFVIIIFLVMKEDDSTPPEEKTV